MGLRVKIVKVFTRHGKELPSLIGDFFRFLDGVLLPRGINFDPVKYVKETLSRVEYACEMNFDSLSRRRIRVENEV